MLTVPKFAGLSWRELYRTTRREAAKSNITNRAAELAFWFLLGSFPYASVRRQHGFDAQFSFGFAKSS